MGSLAVRGDPQSCPSSVAVFLPIEGFIEGFQDGMEPVGRTPCGAERVLSRGPAGYV